MPNIIIQAGSPIVTPGSCPGVTQFKVDTEGLKIKKIGQSTFSPFIAKGLNYAPTPAGCDPNRSRAYCPVNDIAMAKWFANEFNLIKGNTIRVYWNPIAQTGIGNPNADQYSYPGTGGTGDSEGSLDSFAALRFADEMYAKGIHILWNIYVSFPNWWGPGEPQSRAKQANYEAKITNNILNCATVMKNHPATMGYIFGNETNLRYGDLTSPPLGNWNNLTTWFQMANRVLKEVKIIDPCHLTVVSSGGGSTAINGLIIAENAGLLPDVDLHGLNVYRGADWTAGGSVANLWNQWNPINNKKTIILECGQVSTDSTGASLNAMQTSEVTGMWQNQNLSKNVGICYFSAFSEYWKSGNLGIAPTNDGQYTSSYFTANSADFWQKNGTAPEQRFGWLENYNSTPNSTPPTKLPVWTAMGNIW